MAGHSDPRRPRSKNIDICVSTCPDATAGRHFESDNTADRMGVPGLLSELDEYAREQGAVALVVER